MNLKELNTYMRTKAVGLVPSQQTALEALGIKVEYELFVGHIPQARTDILLTSEPVEGEVLMQLRKNPAYSSRLLVCYDAFQSSVACVNTCPKHLKRLFGEIPDSLYVTKVEGASE